jgi:hypothetical protein
MSSGDFPTKLVLPKGEPFKVPPSNGMEIVKINGLPKEDGWYWFTGKAGEDFDEPIYWECEPDFYNGPGNIRFGIDYYVYESGEFWQIRKGE